MCDFDLIYTSKPSENSCINNTEMEGKHARYFDIPGNIYRKFDISIYRNFDISIYRNFDTISNPSTKYLVHIITADFSNTFVNTRY